MVGRFRTILMWLMLLALTVHGIAVASLSYCLSGPGMATVVMQGEHRDGTGLASATAMLASVQTDEQHGMSTADASNLPKFKCDVGSICLAQIALPYTMIQFPSSVPNPATASFGPDQRVAFVTDGPDRPPRSVLP